MSGYRPFEDGPFRLAMGLMALKPAEWIESDDDLAADLAEKRRLLTERRDAVFGETPGSQAAQRETLALLADHLPRHFPDRYAGGGDRIACLASGERFHIADPGMPALEAAARLVQEDLCLLTPQADGSHVLAAACVCFPTRWQLAAKIGQPLAAIHHPVPGYAARLARPVDRFFDHLHADRPVWRLNWGITDDAALFQPVGRGGKADPEVTATTVGERLWLRVERQTLRRLPQSGDALFTIRIHRTRLDALAASATQAGRLAAAVRAMPADYQDYKSLTAYRGLLLDYLDAAAGGESRFT